MKTADRSRKYTVANLLPALRLAAKLRMRMLALGLSDNGGAIHSAERIADLLGLHLKYPELSHRNNLRNSKAAEMSVGASKALEAGEKILIEHVAPHRAFTQNLLRLVEAGKSDKSILTYVRRNYRLVLLSIEETTRLNQKNRSKMDAHRLKSADIVLVRSKR